MKRSYGPHVVDTTNEDKVLFPGGITKKDLIDYYDRIADTMLPHVRERPLVLYRCPDGIEDDCFYQKQVEAHFPDWLDRVTVSRKAGGEQTLVAGDDRAGLVWLANQAVVEFHSWGSRSSAFTHPDRLVIDLDPPDDDPARFSSVSAAALRCREAFQELDIRPWVKTTGSRGLHVVVSLDGKSDFDAVREFAGELTTRLARRHPSDLTTEIRKNKRGDRVFLDVLRNAYAQTAVAPYSLRARPEAPVATPLEWEEVERGDVGPRSWTRANIFRRLGQRDDPWKGMGRHATSVARAARELEQSGGDV